jgi:signal transduction histidine kinase
MIRAVPRRRAAPRPGVGLGSAWLMRRGLRPIEAMAAEADRITAGDLTDRVGPADARTEVGRLGAALNGMLARIGASVAEPEASQQLTRQFFADASHELRNPLASLRANAELYQQWAIPGRPDVDDTIQRIAQEAQRMSRLVDGMLRLARLDQHPGQQRDRVDLTALLASCAERWQRASPRPLLPGRRPHGVPRVRPRPGHRDGHRRRPRRDGAGHAQPATPMERGPQRPSTGWRQPRAIQSLSQYWGRRRTTSRVQPLYLPLPCSGQVLL